MNPIPVVLDTNVIISALLFGGKPRDILRMVIEKKVQAITSPVLISELLDVLSKKFSYPEAKLILIEQIVTKSFVMVYPTKHIDILTDQADNRVHEAATAGKCVSIITGDRGLLNLGVHEGIQIMTSAAFHHDHYLAEA